MLNAVELCKCTGCIQSRVFCKSSELDAYTHDIIYVVAAGTLGNVCICLLSRFVNFTVCAADSRQVVGSVLVVKN